MAHVKCKQVSVFQNRPFFVTESVYCTRRYEYSPGTAAENHATTLHPSCWQSAAAASASRPRQAEAARSGRRCSRAPCRGAAAQGHGGGGEGPEEAQGRRSDCAHQGC